MAQYVDGFVIPIKKKNVAQYKKLAQFGCQAWMKHGAIHYYECVADDYITHGLGFKKMCKLKPDETIIFAYITFKSKSHRDKVNKKVFAEMDTLFKDMKMPFDMKRFATMGCKTLVHSK